MSVLPSWAEALNLRPHPEGGFYAETWRSDRDVVAHGGTRPAGTAIYFLLLAGQSSAWHVVRSAELWLHHRGAPLALDLGGDGDEPGAVARHVLGSDLAAGQRPQVLVSPGVWQRARPVHHEATLVSCVVVPGFTFEDFRLA